MVLGVDAQENPGGPLRPDPAFAFCQAPFLMTFATGGIPHAGSQHSLGSKESDVTELLTLFTSLHR